MDIGLYQSAASLSALERWQDAVSQNISSSQATGYRERTVNFSVQEAGELFTGAKSSSPDAGEPGAFPVASNGINFSPGETTPTGRPLDVAIQNDGFFEVQLADGTHAYTRNGAFSERADGTLVNLSGNQVLNATGGPINLVPGGGDVTINPNGEISQGNVQLGKLSIQNFANTGSLVPISGGNFLPIGGAVPTPVSNPGVVQAHLESSNVSPLHEMVNLVMISRAYEANQKVITNADKQTQKTIDALG